MALVAKSPKVYQEATQACPAYNNMKHTINSNNRQLEVGKEYRILSHKEGQILTLIEGERVAQRWVDEGCFKDKEPLKKEQSTLSSIIDKIKDKFATRRSLSQQNLLAISWQNAFCQTHQYKKECRTMKRDDFAASHFVLHGLWPQPRNNQYCNVSKKEIGMDKNKQWNRLSNLELNSTTQKRLSLLMPGYYSNLHKHEWVKHGSCYGKDPNGYYDDAMNLLDQVNNSKVQSFFEKNLGKKVSLKEIRKVFDATFGEGAGEHVTMNCRQGLITELWLHIGSGSSKLERLLKKGERPKSRCFKGKIDRVGY
jgi:ribonuclease T2